MTEYIIGIEGTLHEDYIELAPKISGEIIRCRDCRHYKYWEFKDGQTAHDCERGGDYLFDTEQNGFCAWGERMVDGE